MNRAPFTWHRYSKCPTKVRHVTTSSVTLLSHRRDFLAQITSKTLSKITASAMAGLCDSTSDKLQKIFTARICSCTSSMSAISLTRCLTHVMTERNVPWLTTIHSTLTADSVILRCIGTSFSPISLHTWTRGCDDRVMEQLTNVFKYLSGSYNHHLIISIHNVCPVTTTLIMWHRWAVHEMAVVFEMWNDR